MNRPRTTAKTNEILVHHRQLGLRISGSASRPTHERQPLRRAQLYSAH